jgi:hypothetical protein
LTLSPVYLQSQRKAQVGGREGKYASLPPHHTY